MENLVKIFHLAGILEGWLPYIQQILKNPNFEAEKLSCDQSLHKKDYSLLRRHTRIFFFLYFK